MFAGFKTTLAATACALACFPCFATVEMEGIALDDSVQVAGRHLKLNGAGISKRLIFKIYALGLYLSDHRATVQEVLESEGPRRLAIAMLRDVSGADFNEALLDYVAAERASLQEGVAGSMLHLGKAIASQPQGLRKGDTLTLDWVPGTGTLVELNKKPLTTPLRDIAVYNALLNIWLGEKPADPALKTKLLGRPPIIRTALTY